MRFSSDSCFAVLVAALLLAVPAHAATAKKPVKAAAKVAAPVIEPQPDPILLVTRSREAQGRGETELALRLAQAAIVADPARPSSYDALGDIYAALGQPDFARSYYSTALSIDPSDAPALQATAALDRGATDQRAANAEGIKTGTP